MIPSSLYLLLKWVFEGCDRNDLSMDTDTIKSLNLQTHQKILACSQDILFTTSKARCRTPKHICLAVAVKHLTGSKHLVTLLPHAGHTVSYDDVQRIDTAMAEHILRNSDNGIVIPSNLQRGTFFHDAADNVDRWPA